MKKIPMKYAFMTVSIVALVAYSFVAFAAPHVYGPGEKLEPDSDCLPDNTCTVSTGWFFNADTEGFYNETGPISIGTNDGTLPLTVIGAMENLNETSEGFSIFSTDDGVFGSPGFYFTSASSGLSYDHFLDDDYAGFTGTTAVLSSIAGSLQLGQNNFVDGLEKITSNIVFSNDRTNLFYNYYNDSGDLDSQAIIGGFKTDTVSPGTYRTGLGVSVYDYDHTDGTANDMQYGFSAYTAHADHFVYDMTQGIDTRAYTVEDDGTREEVLFNITNPDVFSVNGRVVSEDENTLYFNRQVDHGLLVQERSLSLDADGLNYRSDGGSILFADTLTENNTSHLATLDYDFTGPEVQQKFYFDFANQAIRMGAVSSNTWDPGASVGTGSIAFGFADGTTETGPVASGDYSIAIGQSNIVGGNQSMALGTGLKVDGDQQVDVGSFTTTYIPSGTSTDRQFTVGNGQTGSRSDAFTILKNGQVGIGIDNFDAETNGNMLQVGDGAGNLIGYVDDGTGNWVAVSDERQKQNIQALSYGLDAVNQLRPVAFDYRRNGEHTIGFIAQDTIGVVPEAVYGTDASGYGMSYQTLVPVVVKAIQELDLKIEAIRAAAGNVTDHTGMVAWFADAANGIRDLFTDRLFTREIHASDMVCINATCITEAELQNLIEQSGGTTTPTPELPSSTESPAPDPEPTVSTDETIETPTGDGVAPDPAVDDNYETPSA